MNYKRMAVFAVCALILCTALSAEDFAWSECWKNYGGTVKEGDFIVNAGLGTSSFALEHQDYDAEYRLPTLKFRLNTLRKSGCCRLRSADFSVTQDTAGKKDLKTTATPATGISLISVRLQTITFSCLLKNLTYIPV